MTLYQGYGLVIESELELPALPPGQGHPQLWCRLGPVPRSLGERARRGYRFEADSDRLLFKTHTIADYLVAQPTITIDIKAGADDNEVRNLVTGPVLGALLLQRRQLGLHAAALERAGRGTLICAASGIGKSSLAWALLQKGYRILDDNLAAIGWRDGRPLVYPGSPTTRMWPANLERLCPKVGATKCFASLDKLAASVSPGQFCPVATEVERIFVLTRSDSFALRRLSGAEKLRLFRAHVFCARFLSGSSVEASLFAEIVRLAGLVDAFLVELPEGHPERWGEYLL